MGWRKVARQVVELTGADDLFLRRISNLLRPTLRILWEAILFVIALIYYQAIFIAQELKISLNLFLLFILNMLLMWSNLLL